MRFAKPGTTNANYTAGEFHQNDLANFAGAGVLPLWWTGSTLMALVPNEMLFYPDVDRGQDRVHLLGGAAMSSDELKQHFGDYVENGLVLTAVQELWEETGMMPFFDGRPVMTSGKWTPSVKQEWVNWLQQSWKMWYAAGSYGLYVPICDAAWVAFFNEAIAKYVRGGKKEANYLAWVNIRDIQNSTMVLTRGGVHIRSDLLSGVLQSLLKDQLDRFKIPANISPYPDRQLLSMRVPAPTEQALRSKVRRWQVIVRAVGAEIGYPSDLSAFAAIEGNGEVHIDARFIDRAIELIIEGTLDKITVGVTKNQ